LKPALHVDKRLGVDRRPDFIEEGCHGLGEKSSGCYRP
jgi:hypothetical protein